MSVSVSRNASLRPFPAKRPPHLPSYVWFAEGFLGGDASGGSITVVLALQSFLQKAYYSLEALTAQWGDASGTDLAVTWSKGDNPSLIDTFTWSLDMVAVAAAAVGPMSAYAGPPPVKGYIAEPRAGGVASITVVGGNPGGASSLLVSAWGYYWARADLPLLGMPVRP